MQVNDCAFSEITTIQLQEILWLRQAVFVVEQECAYLDIDGRDDATPTRHIWIEDDGIVAYLRLLEDGSSRRIGRVATRVDARGNGLAAQLVQHVLDTTSGPWVLDAQCRLEPWYQRFDFERMGPDFDEDGVMHLPMRRLA